MMETKRFYDAHMHVFDLSHPNLLAFIDRLFDNVSEKWYFKSFKNSPVLLKPLLTLIASPILAWKSRKLDAGIINHFLNCLSVMENPIEHQFLMIEYFLQTKGVLVTGGKLRIGNESYDKIALCPLMMDFGNKNMDVEGIFYNLAPHKPVIKQTEDLLNAMKFYHEKALQVTDGTAKWNYRTNEEKLFEIYPFIGLNTENYEPDRLKHMFGLYFDGYEKDTKKGRMERFSDAKGKRFEFEGNLNLIETAADLTRYFAGVKVYPPLGFNPLPNESEDGGKAREKADLLYKTAIEKRIPIITHCSDSGFTTCLKADEYTDPGKAWSNVLSENKGLKLCFAHFGSQKDWQKTIIGLIEQYDNVYADISCCKGDKKYYNELYALMKSHPKLQSRILFGTDFSINLFTGEHSYNDYIRRFNEYFNNEFTDLLCSVNPERFLFETGNC